jgi:CheY-like chemotaxis protein
MVLEDVLRDIGFTSFDVAISVQQAIAFAAAKCPDLITSDVMLNPGNGIDAIEAICRGRPAPVIFITSSPEQVQARLPAYSIVRKPFSSAEVTEAVRRLAA